MKIKVMLVGMMATMAVLLGIVGAAIPAQPAAAEAYWIAAGHDSADSFSIWNKKGCMGASQFLRAGEDSSVTHLWKTVWVPRHRRMHFLDLQSGVSYHVDNRHDYKTCHDAGRWFSIVGWEIWTTKY